MLVKWRVSCASTLIMCLIFSTLNVSSSIANSQDKNKSDKASKSDKATKGDKANKEPKADKGEKKEKKKDSGSKELQPVLWEEPTDLESRDLFNGPAGPEGAPDPKGKFTFVERSKSGTSEKINVDDDRGR